MLGQLWMLNPFSFAKCNRHMKHKCGDMSIIVAAPLHLLGKLVNICLKDTTSFLLFKQPMKELELITQLQITGKKIDHLCT